MSVLFNVCVMWGIKCLVCHVGYSMSVLFNVCVM